MQILIETKKICEPLRWEHASQLYRYFSVTNARIAILTNGQVWEFYTDLDEPNKMDAKPFLVLDLDSVISAAGELKYIGAIKRTLAAEFREPSEEWVRYLGVRVFSGKNFTRQVREQFVPLVEKAAHQFLTEQVNERLKTALGPEAVVDQTAPATPSTPPTQNAPVEPGEPEPAADVVTTDTELEAFRIVRAIVCSEVPATRIVSRDAKTYFGILLDDNNRKPIARLWFNRAQRYLGVFDENKTEIRIPIDDTTDIYAHADQLRRTVAAYLARDTERNQPLVPEQATQLAP